MVRQARVSPLPTVDEMRDNILDVYRRASRDQLRDGRDWYGRAEYIVRSIASVTNTSEDRIAMALAALSPRNPWLWNVQDTYAYAMAAQSGDVRPTATTFKRNQAAAWRALTGDTPWAGLAPKVRSFAMCITGNLLAVVVDVWAVRVASRGIISAVRDADYQSVVEAYKLAAFATGERPADIQAITWLVAQGESLGQKVKAKHHLTYKAGTSDFVRHITKGR